MNIYILQKSSLISAKTNEIKGKPGLWMLIGKNKNGLYSSLQVGHSQNIGSEIERDISYLTTIPPTSEKDILYVNQFGEELFPYENYNFWRAKNLYHQIATHYTNLNFICIANHTALENENNRKILEKYIAYKTTSRYWSNGGIYKPKTETQIKTIIEACLVECEQLYKSITKFNLGIKQLNIIDEYIANLSDDDL